MEFFTKVSIEEQKEIAKHLFGSMNIADENGLSALKRKFSSKAFSEVSKYKIEKTSKS